MHYHHLLKDKLPFIAFTRTPIRKPHGLKIKRWKEVFWKKY